MLPITWLIFYRHKASTKKVGRRGKGHVKHLKGVHKTKILEMQITFSITVICRLIYSET